MLKLFWLIFLLFTMSAKVFALPSSTPSQEPLFLESYTSDELQEAKLISSFVTQLRRSNLDSWTIRLLTQKKEFKLLPNFKLITEQAQKIYASKHGESFHQACDKDALMNDVSSLNSIERNLVTELHAVCRVRFIENLLSSKVFKTLPAPDREYLSANSRFYLLKDRRHLLKRYLKMIDRDSELHAFISQVVTDAYIKFDIIAEKDVVTLLDVSHDLTGHIQNNGLRGLASNVLFEKEFRNLIRNGYQNDDANKRRESSNHAIAFQIQNSSFIRQSVAWMNFIMLGKELTHLGEWKLSELVLNHAHSIAKGSEQIDESLFQLLFAKVLEKDTKSLYAFIDKHELLKNYDQHSSKLQFWVAYGLESFGSKEMASRLFERLLTNNPLSFYTIVAQREYQNLNNKKFIPDLPKPIHAEKAQISPQLKLTLKRLRLWIKQNDRYLAEMEIRRLKSLAPQFAFQGLDTTSMKKNDFKNFLMSQTTELLNYEKAYLTSFKILYKALEDGSMPVSLATLEYLFPSPYLNDIKQIDSDIDPLLVLSLIRQESAFNPEARSHVGARGLMQLMPATAREMKRGVKNHHLVDPDLNLKLGIKYFKRLLRKYDGNLIHALAAYNAGEGNVKRWIGTKLVHEDPLVMIESIPFKETRKYVKLIYRNIFFYKYLAGDNSFFKLPIADSFNATSIATANRAPATEELGEN